MGILDSIVGEGAGGVKKRARSGEEAFLQGTRDEILGSESFAKAGSLRQAGIRSLKFGRPGERSGAVGSAAADVGQASTVGRGSDAFANASRRASALTRLGGATGRDFDSQLLRDRITSVGGGLQRQATGRGIVQGALGIRDRVAGASTDAQARAKSARSNIAGSIAGAALSLAAPGIGSLISKGRKGFQSRKIKSKLQAPKQVGGTGAGGGAKSFVSRFSA